MFASPYFWCALVAMLLAGGVARAWWPRLVRQRREAETVRAQQAFRRQRELLEAKFLAVAAQNGKPRGLRWVDCEWLDAVNFARERGSGKLMALVGVNIRFEAIEGGDMEDVAAVGNIRDAAAVFEYERGTWITRGRALFNLSPSEAVARLDRQFEPVASLILHT